MFEFRGTPAAPDFVERRLHQVVLSDGVGPDEVAGRDPPLSEESGVVAGTGRGFQRLDRYLVRHGVEDGCDVSADAELELFDQGPVGADELDLAGQHDGHALGDLVLAGVEVVSDARDHAANLLLVSTEPTGVVVHLHGDHRFIARSADRAAL